MKRIEFVFGGTAALAILLKFLHLPFSAMLLLVSISALAVVYMGYGANTVHWFCFRIGAHWHPFQNAAMAYG
jgi:hypothetical protein